MCFLDRDERIRQGVAIYIMYSLIDERSIFLNFPKTRPITDKMNTGNTILNILKMLVHPVSMISWKIIMKGSEI